MKIIRFRKQVTSLGNVFVLFCLLTLNLQPTETVGAQTVPNLSFQADIFGTSAPEKIEYNTNLAFLTAGGFGINASTYGANLTPGDGITYAFSIRNTNTFTLDITTQAGNPLTLSVSNSDYSKGLVESISANELHFVWDINQFGLHVKLHRYVSLFQNDLITVKNVIEEIYVLENLGENFTLNGFSEYLHMDDTTSARDYNNDGKQETLLAINTFTTPRYPVFGKVYLAQMGSEPQFTISSSFATATQHFPGVPANTAARLTMTRADFVSSVSRNNALAETEVAEDAALLLPAPTTLAISHIEVTQAVQDELNNVPLVANKLTFARVYIDCGTGCSSAERVTGSLRAYRSGNPNPLPFLINGQTRTDLKPINLNIKPTKESWTEQRKDLGKSLNFTLPAEWTTGNITLVAIVQSLQKTQNLIFVETKPLKIAYIPIEDNGYKPVPKRIQAASAFARKVYPSNISYPSKIYPTLVWVHSLRCPGMAYREDRIFCEADDLTKKLESIKFFGVSHEDFLFGWLPQESTNNLDPLTGFAGAGGASWPFSIYRNLAAWAIDSPVDASKTFTHEIAHLLGRHHTNTRDNINHSDVCAVKTDPSLSSDERAYVDTSLQNDWTFQDSRIQDWGLDGYSLELGNRALKDPSITYDYMSYCGRLANGNVWTSAWTYAHIMERPKTISQPTVTPAEITNNLVTGQLYAIISGLIFSDDRAVLDPAWIRMTDLAGVDPPVGTTYCLQAQNFVGTALAQYCFDVNFTDYETGDATTVVGFNLMLPYPPGVTRIVLKKGTLELASQEVSAHPPSVSVTYPNGGETWNAANTYTISWNANDADGDALTFNVFYSPDGVQWLPLGIEISDTQLTVDASELPGSSNARIRVEVSDGINTSSDESNAVFTVGRKVPQTTITSPNNNEANAFGATIVLSGSSYDIEDGLLGDNSLVWTSSIDGALGTGSNLLTSLSAGQHTITLTATDGDQNSSSAAITLNVVMCRILNLAFFGEGNDIVATPDRSAGCPEGNYTAGESISLRAFPAVNWAVSSWAGTIQDDTNATTNLVTMPASDHSVAVNYVLACFAINTSLNPGNAGIVWINQITDGIFNPPPRCQDDNQYPYGAVIRLTANPEPGYTFNNWVGDISGNTNPVEITMLSDKSVAAHFTNGEDTTGVFHPSNGALYLKNANTTGIADIQINYGISGDYPVVGDWDGNGTVTIGIYRNGSFYLRNENTIGFADVVFPFGAPGDQPMAGDWNGDGVDTIGVYRNGTFFLRNTNSSGDPEMVFSLGIPGDVGIAGDWNGDGIDTTGVFRPSNGALYLKNENSTGIADIQINYGLPGDRPVTGDWDNDGVDTIGVYRNGQFMLRNSNTIGFADWVFALGIPGDMPIAGNWDGIP